MPGFFVGLAVGDTFNALVPYWLRVFFVLAGIMDADGFAFAFAARYFVVGFIVGFGDAFTARYFVAVFVGFTVAFAAMYLVVGFMVGLTDAVTARYFVVGFMVGFAVAFAARYFVVGFIVGLTDAFTARYFVAGEVFALAFRDGFTDTNGVGLYVALGMLLLLSLRSPVPTF